MDLAINKRSLNLLVLYDPNLTVDEIGDFFVHFAVLRWFKLLILSRELFAGGKGYCKNR